MKRILRSFRAVDFRLALAVAACVVLFVATPTTPTNSDTRGGGKDGTIAFTNDSEWTIKVSISGSGSPKCTTINPQRLQYMFGVKPGYYAWRAQSIDGGIFHYVAAHFVTVEKDQTVGVYINIPDD